MKRIIKIINMVSLYFFFFQIFPMDSLTKSINQFALEFSKKLAESAEGKNIFFSPWGISTSLAMVYLGTRCTTASQIAQVSGKAQSPSLALNKMFSLPFIFIFLPNSRQLTFYNHSLQNKRSTIKIFLAWPMWFSG